MLTNQEFASAVYPYQSAIQHFTHASFPYQIPVVEVALGQVKGREDSLGLLLGLVSSLEQYFRRNNIFFAF